jgi:hypothetical protein
MKDISIDEFKISSQVKIQNLQTKYNLESEEKEIEKKMNKLSKKLAYIQNTMYAHGKYSVLMCIQGMDTAGADIGPLKNDNIVLAGLRPDSQRYFDHHHAANDTFDAVNKRELELGAATMTSLVYLFDKYGVNQVKNIPQIKD